MFERLPNWMRARLRRSRFLLLFGAATVWRCLLFRTTFIAITGSVGKTTTKECLARVLSSFAPTAQTLNNENDTYGVSRSILRVRPWHRFAIIEVGTVQPGMISRAARLVRPHIAVVLAVARTHTNVFRTLEDTATEKTQLLDGLSPRGIAILNADDPRVRTMTSRCRGRVLMFGRSADADLRVDEVSSQWPARLRLRVRTQGETYWVQTALVGEHWTSTVAATLLTAQTCGLPLQLAIETLRHVQPFMGRMQPVRLPNGAIILRDEGNGAVDTFHVALKVLREAEGMRRVLVMSDSSDSGTNARIRNRTSGRLASEVADLAVFVGENANYAAKAAIASGMAPRQVQVFFSLQHTTEYLQGELRQGDLVLLKGRITDHLSRLVFAHFGPIGCWKSKCSKIRLCDLCEELQPEFDLSMVKRQERG